MMSLSWTSSSARTKMGNSMERVSGRELEMSVILRSERVMRGLTGFWMNEVVLGFTEFTCNIFKGKML